MVGVAVDVAENHESNHCANNRSPMNNNTNISGYPWAQYPRKHSTCVYVQRSGHGIHKLLSSEKCGAAISVYKARHRSLLS